MTHSSPVNQQWLHIAGTAGPGKGKHIVFVSGDEEYRSEEALPMLAKILAVRHGFTCTVLFAIDPDCGCIQPDIQTNIPGLEALQTADLMVIFTRFRELPDAQMRYIDEYVQSGKPIIGTRTATHAFRYPRNPQSPYAKYGCDSKDPAWLGGFGRQVLGDSWVDHHGAHGKEGTRGIINPAFAQHPVLKGVTDIFGPTDVYTISNLPPDAEVVVHGQVLTGLKPTDAPVTGTKNDPMMPLIWLRNYVGKSGNVTSVLCSTIGASVDFESAGLRRLFVNACYWLVGMEDRITPKSCADCVGDYRPTFYGLTYAKGMKPADYADVPA